MKTKKLFALNVGTLQARGLYNITPNDANDTRLSLWFDESEYNRLKKLPANEFNKECEKILSIDSTKPQRQNDIICHFKYNQHPQYKPKPAPVMVTVLYRDGANYKDTLTVENKTGVETKIGEEVTIEALGYSVGEFWKQYMKHPYDPDYDHNILEVLDPE